MAEVIAFIKDDEVKVWWNLDLPTERPPTHEALEKGAFIENFDLDLWGVKAWPYGNYSGEISQIFGSGTTGPEGEQSSLSVIIGLEEVF